MNDHLLPPNATPGERALSETVARVSDVPSPLRDLWNPNTCPAELLPWLAWAFSLDSWKSYWPEKVKRERIRQAVEIQRHKGSVKSVRDVVQSFGANLSLREWWQTSPPGAPHSFQVALNLNQSGDVSQRFQDDIVAEVWRTKPARSYFTLIAGINAEGGMGLLGAARTCIYRRISTQE